MSYTYMCTLLAFMGVLQPAWWITSLACYLAHRARSLLDPKVSLPWQSLCISVSVLPCCEILRGCGALVAKWTWDLGTWGSDVAVDQIVS